MRLLLSSSSSCNLEHQDLHGETALFIAIRRGKLLMIRDLVAAGCNVNHCNKNGENVLFVTIKAGRKDLAEYTVDAGVNVNAVNTEGSTAVLLALELYENYFFRLRGYATRRSAPSNVHDIIAALIPSCSCLNHLHPNRGSALRIALNIEATHLPCDLKLTKLLLQHGATPDRLFFLRYGGLVASNTVPGAEFFTEKFFNMAIVAGANLQRERAWLFTVLSEMPEELSPHLQLFHQLLLKCSNPLPLQSLCIMGIRKALSGRPLWKNIDGLPLPPALKDAAKLVY